MARFDLNIYGKDDEIIKSFSTSHLRWGLLVSAVDLQERIKDDSAEEQIKAINEFMLEVFPGMTEEDLRYADSMDVMNVFAQIGKLTGKLNGKNV